VATRPSERKFIARRCDVAELQARVARGKKVRAIGDPVASIGDVGPLFRGVTKVDVGRVAGERHVLSWGDPAKGAFDTERARVADVPIGCGLVVSNDADQIARVADESVDVSLK